MAPAAVAVQPIQPFFEPRSVEEALQLRDAELDALRKQLDKVKQDLAATSAERDYLRHASFIREGHDTVLKRRRTHESDDDETPTNPRELPGTSLATPVRDSRIGRPKRILIVGGGPAGIIALRELLSPANRPDGEKMDDIDIRLYERRAQVGGVWYYEPGNDVAKGWASSDGSFVKVDKPELNGSGGSKERWSDGKVNGEHEGDKKPTVAPWWPTPAYDGLVGNVLPPLIEFTTHPMPKPKKGLFPSMKETFSYLYNLAAPAREHVTVHREVTSIHPVYQPGRHTPTWIVKSNDWDPNAGYDEGDTSARSKTEDFDAIIIAAGAFDHPFFPPTPGLEPLLKSKSPLVMHAKTYPGPLPFLNQQNRIVVVGNANSANDIAAHLAPLNSGGPLFRSVRHESKFPHLPDDRIVDVAPIAKIETERSDTALEETLTLHLEDGNKLTGITKLIFASGYQYRFDWVKVPSSTSPCFVSPSEDDVNRQLDLKGASYAGAVPNLHLATFMSTAPTLAFIGLGAGSTPCPLAEIQARAASRLYHGLLSLPCAPPETAGCVEALGDPQNLLKDFHDRVDTLDLDESSPHGWRGLHMIRGAPERELTAELLDFVERSEPGASDGLFRWDDEREGVVKNMRMVKESELRRLRDEKVASGGVPGGLGGVLAISHQFAVSGGRFTAPKGEYRRGMAVGL